MNTVWTRGAATLAASLGIAAAADKPAMPDVAQYERVLTEYVRDDGRVNYAGIKSSGALAEFTKQLAAVSPDSHPALFPSREAKLAYWINAYNALVLHSFAADYPAKRQRLGNTLGRGLFFYKTKHSVGGRGRSLAEIEDHSIRNMGDPRIHFAIVCASAGCPALSRRAYRPETLNAQLEAETKKYFSESRNFSIDTTRREVKLPKIFEWFKDDFGKTDDKVIDFVARYRPNEAAQLRSGRWKLAYSEYDWSPNDIRR
jgi:hypothetical protein